MIRVGVVIVVVAQVIAVTAVTIETEAFVRRGFKQFPSNGTDRVLSIAK